MPVPAAPVPVPPASPTQQPSGQTQPPQPRPNQPVQNSGVIQSQSQGLKECLSFAQNSTQSEAPSQAPAR